MLKRHLSKRSELTKIIPIDTDNFKKIRENGMAYVDKTNLILQNIIGNRNGCYHFLSRPRRFGKSLVCTTIGEIFRGDKNLFKGLAIENRWDFQSEECTVIHLNMSNLGHSLESVLRVISLRLKRIAEVNNVKLPKSDLRFPHVQFESLIIKLAMKSEKNIVVIIDEYDAPVQDLMDNLEEQSIVVKVLADLYGVLKVNEQYLRLVYITGILKFSNMSIFSKLNNIQDHTFDPKFATMCGYTEEELLTNFEPHLEQLSLKSPANSIVQVIAKLQKEYNGYCFSVVDEDSDDALSPTVFNPFALNYVLSLNRYVDKWSESGHSRFLVKKIIKAKAEVKAVSNIDVPMSDLVNKATPDSISYEALMYFAGYSTIRKYNHITKMVTLAPPNDNINVDLIREILIDYKCGVDYQLAKDVVQFLFAGEKEQHRIAKQYFSAFPASIIEQKQGIAIHIQCTVFVFF
jgi:hypothetical protein